MKSLPPNGRKFLAQQPGAGLWVAIGSNSWQFAHRKPFPVVVLPPGELPGHYRWPQTGRPALIFETGSADDNLITAVATSLIDAGAPVVTAIRESLLTNPESCVYFYADSVPRGD